MRATLLVLAGGAGRRMGRPKAWLPAGGVTLVEHVLARLSPSFDETLVSLVSPEQMEVLLPCRIVFDRVPDLGPLGGLEAGLSVASHDITFVLACDMPHVSPATARLAVAAAASCDAAVPRPHGRAQPLAAAYRRSALPSISAAIDSRQLAVTAVVEALDVTWLEDLDPAEFGHVNDPAGYAAFHNALQQSDN